MGDQNDDEVTAGIKTPDIDTENSSDFVNTTSDTRDVTRPAGLEHLMTLDLVKTEGDEDWPFVSGMDFFPDGRLVGLDQYNNKCIVFDDKLSRRGVYNLETQPYDVTCFGGDNLAVTLKYVYTSSLIQP